jgi:hypothetical protein
MGGERATIAHRTGEIGRQPVDEGSQPWRPHEERSPLGRAGQRLRSGRGPAQVLERLGIAATGERRSQRSLQLQVAGLRAERRAQHGRGVGIRAGPAQCLAEGPAIDAASGGGAISTAARSAARAAERRPRASNRMASSRRSTAVAGTSPSHPSR